ncbi:MAG: hypothetical protein NZM25_08135 [Leptospiraceae bacterium]|nr:hypothetical protein [Leptospiraceae bacterium]MDW8307660.1 hypothetical protein [Leptospiraceae bacterium]
MKFSPWTYALLPLLGILIYLGENYLEYYRQKQFVLKALEDIDTQLLEIENNLLEFQEKVNPEFVIERLSISIGVLEEFLRQNPFIRELAFYSSQGKLVAGSNLKLPLYLDIESIPPHPSKNKRFFLDNHRWFLFMEIPESDGYLLAEIKLPLLYPEGELGIYHSLQGSFSLPEKMRHDEEFIKRLSEKAKNSTPSFWQISSTSGNYQILFQYWRNYAIYLMSIVPSNLYYKRPSFYFLISTLFLAFSVLIFSLVQARNKRIEELAQKQQQIISTHKESLENYRQILNQPNPYEQWQIPQPIEQAEYLFAEGQIEEVAAEEKEREVVYRKKEPLVIEVVATHKEFIFPEIEEEAPQAVKPSEALEKLRKRAFSQELLHLFEEVSPTSPKTPFRTGLQTLQKEFETFQTKEWFRLLNNLYFDEITPQELTACLGYLKGELNADALCFLHYNPYVGCYQTMASHGFDIKTDQNLYLLEEDSVIRVNNKKDAAYKISFLHKKNPYFAKRFSQDFLEKLNAYLAIPLHKWQLRGYLLAFYHSQNPHLPPTELHTDFLQKLKELLPALKTYMADTLKLNYRDQVIEFAREMRSLGALGQKRVLVLHFYLQEPIVFSQYSQIKETISGKLSENERLIFSNPNHIILLLLPSRTKEELEELERIIPQAQVVELTYPESGISYLRYF